jgi:RNA polymerase sigma factor (TIGR02999 family)
MLRRWSDGDPGVLAALAEAAYTDLRAIAAGYLRREGRDHTLQATGLVNELYLRLARQHSAQFTDRRHFFSFAALMMRRILTDYARHAKPSRERIPLHPEMAWVDAADEDMLALSEALDELAALDERKVQVIELRYFLGCTNDEVAELLGLAQSTVDRDLHFAKSWLYRKLHPLN